jgi:hypothetical protein
LTGAKAGAGSAEEAEMNGKRSARIDEVSPSSLAIWARSVMRAARSRSLPGEGDSVAPSRGLTPEGSITACVAVR